MFRVVLPYQRVLHFRLGNLIGVKGPGFVFPVFPIIDQTSRVDLRERVLDVEPQTCITKDNAPVSVDMLVYLRVTNAEDAVVKVEDFVAASRGIAITTLRAVVGDMSLDDVLSKREQINQIMRAKLDEVTDRWGIKVNAVEIREILPPRDIQDAMSRQMSAERHRRATVTDADGQRAAAVTIAEGDKQAAILNAEGNRQSAVLNAEGARQSAILNAEGFANALQQIYESARGVDDKTMSLQYMDMLKVIGASPSTKWILPLDLINMASSISQTLGNGQSASDGAQPARQGERPQ